MSNIKAANSASEPVVSTEKELQLVKQQQEIRASETLFQKLSKTVTKQPIQMTNRNSPRTLQKSLSHAGGSPQTEGIGQLRS